ncbi:MAG: hypothetical protein ACKO2P_09725 [Planctomycetota bacterium]
MAPEGQGAWHRNAEGVWWVTFTTTAQQEFRRPGKWPSLEMERHRSRVVGSAGTVPGGLAGWISAALPRLCNRGYRCNIANHHKRKKRPNHRSQI